MSLPNNRNGLPVYRRIAADLWEKIQSGALNPGEQLASENNLSEEYGVSRLTVRQAIVELQRLGAIEIKRGIGTFISKAPDLVEIVAKMPATVQHSDSTVVGINQHLENEAENSDSTQQQLSDEVDEKIDNPLPTRPLRKVEERKISFGPDQSPLVVQAANYLDRSPEDLLRLDTVMYKSGKPWIVNSYWFVKEYSGLESFFTEGETVVNALISGFESQLSYQWRAFSAVGADFQEAELLGTQTGAALLVRDGVTGNRDGEAIFYVRRRLRGEDSKFVLRYGDPADYS